MVRITEIKALPEYKLHLKFNDGIEGMVDLSSVPREGAFSIWNLPGEFEKVYLDNESGSPKWNEDLDIDVLSQYLKITGKSFEEYINPMNAKN